MGCLCSKEEPQEAAEKLLKPSDREVLASNWSSSGSSPAAVAHHPSKPEKEEVKPSIDVVQEVRAAVEAPKSTKSKKLSKNQKRKLKSKKKP